MAFVDDPIIIESGEWKLISTGIYIKLPAGFEAQVRPRSGLALKKGITVLNSPGTIDSDYRGELMVLATWIGEGDSIKLSKGERGVLNGTLQFIDEPSFYAKFGHGMILILSSLILGICVIINLCRKYLF